MRHEVGEFRCVGLLLMFCFFSAAFGPISVSPPPFAVTVAAFQAAYQFSSAPSLAARLSPLAALVVVAAALVTAHVGVRDFLSTPFTFFLAPSGDLQSLLYL